MTNKRATNIQQVAKIVGCSRVTVARVFSNKVKVSDKTRRKVLKAAEESGYSPNLLARALRGGKTNSIALVCSLTGAHNPSEVPQEISRLFWENEAKSSFWGRAPMETMPMLLNDYLQRSVEGIVFEWQLSRRHEIPRKLLEEFKAAVIISGEEQDIDADQVIWTRSEAICEAVDFLLKSERKHPALVCVPESNRTKLAAFDKTLEKYGINPAEHHIFPEPNINLANPKGCHDTLSLKFPSGKIPFDSLVCASDELAIVCISWLKENGIKVPEDVAVIGFNNSELSAFISPPLASAERKHKEIGRTAYELLSSRMKNPDLPKRRIHIPMEFAWRESAGKYNRKGK